VTTSPAHTAVLDFLDHLRGAWRFRWIALIVAWCTALALWTVIFIVPDTYEASARVFVDTRTTLSEATQGISLGVDIDSQIQRVRQALLGGPQLQKVADQTNLLVGALTAPAKQAVVDKLRKDIEISGGLSRESPTAAVFTITYKNHVRARSLQVVDRLLNTFVEGTLGGKRQGSEQAEQFLLSQIADYEQRLSAAEQRLADFKKRNVGLMPGEQGDYFTRLQSETDGLTKAKEDLGVAMRKREELQRQLRGEQPFVGAAPTAGGASSAGAPPDTGSRIEETQRHLDELLLRFTDKHPDVIALRQTLKELKAKQQEEIAAAKRGDLDAAARVGLGSNPVYQKIEEQYNQSQVDIASLQQNIADRERKIASLRAVMDSAPEVEAQYARLNRDYDVTRAQYKALIERLDRARLGQEAEATGIVKFEVIDPPTAKFEPVAPNRPLLIAGSLLLALAAGAGAAYLLHMIRPVFVSTRQLAAVTGLQVLGAVGLAWADRFQSRRRRGGVLYVGGAAALVVLGAFVLILQSHISSIVRGLIA
jgi:polysaccharide chain length determinant protein (PEP-CTERM system associated)